MQQGHRHERAWRSQSKVSRPYRLRELSVVVVEDNEGFGNSVQGVDMCICDISYIRLVLASSSGACITHVGLQGI